MNNDQREEIIEEKALKYAEIFNDKLKNDQAFSKKTSALPFITPILQMAGLKKYKILSKTLGGISTVFSESGFSPYEAMKEYKTLGLSKKVEDHLTSMLPNNISQMDPVDMLAFEHFMNLIRVEEHIGSNNEFVQNTKAQFNSKIRIPC